MQSVLDRDVHFGILNEAVSTQTTSLDFESDDGGVRMERAKNDLTKEVFEKLWEKRRLHLPRGHLAG